MRKVSSSGASVRQPRSRGAQPSTQPLARASARLHEAALDGQRFLSQFDATLAPYPESPAQRTKAQARLSQLVSKSADGLPKRLQRVLQELRGTGISDVDLFHGSHAVCHDRGARYERWRRLGAAPRISSHYVGSQTPQYELDLKGLGVLLFGRTPDGATWFQLEAHSGRGGVSALLHVGDFLKSLSLGALEGRAGLNVGPFGLSPRSEKRGTELHLQPARSGRAR